MPKKKKRTLEQDADDMDDEDEDVPDHDAVALEAQLAALDSDTNNRAEDEQPSKRDLDDTDDVAGDVTASDSLTVDIIVQEADLDAHLPPLPCTVRAKSAIAITKVCNYNYQTIISFFHA